MSKPAPAGTTDGVRPLQNDSESIITIDIIRGQAQGGTKVTLLFFLYLFWGATWRLAMTSLALACFSCRAGSPPPPAPPGCGCCPCVARFAAADACGIIIIIIPPAPPPPAAAVGVGGTNPRQPITSISCSMGARIRRRLAPG
jgi:hypothetical protein